MRWVSTGDVLRVEHGKDIAGAAPDGVGLGLVGLVAAALPARIEHKQLVTITQGSHVPGIVPVLGSTENPGWSTSGTLVPTTS